jgi:hypothetical protein
MMATRSDYISERAVQGRNMVNRAGGDRMGMVFGVDRTTEAGERRTVVAGGMGKDIEEGVIFQAILLLEGK